MNIPEVDAHQAKELLDDKQAIFLDVREPVHYKEGHIPGALSIDDFEIMNFIEKFPKDRRLVIYCYAGNFSRTGVSYLKQKGFKDVITLWGGIEHWNEHYAEFIEVGDPPPIPYPED